jgi:hypothetical protein
LFNRIKSDLRWAKLAMGLAALVAFAVAAGVDYKW